MAQVQAEHSVLINRPVEDVFAYVADQTNEPKWHTDVLDVSPAGPIELGRIVTWQLNYMGKNEPPSDESDALAVCRQSLMPHQLGMI